ncbi:VOC family protein [Streptantibioticus rubrisoli]|uniref:VOC family protein n=1 Tax=Streptantibioticus rubrisoli TaxID=1387313 RepID=A0ABT1PMJ0_9ACTN|nr:VOC family protein [Streptantibioticus rubrisoli]MCQ4045783.1 VOC family protein [Streptantibioticus rubrisoli]
MFQGIRTVMVFADDPEKSARWWADVLEAEEIHLEVENGRVYAWLDVDGVELGFHPADDARNPRGGSPVVYWAVDDVDAVRQRLLDAGCTHHRGPIEAEPGRKICQLTDPFGTIIGIDGPGSTPA